MAALGKRGRAIVVSDDDDDDAIAPESTPRQIATLVSKLDSTSREAVSPSKTFPSSPPTGAKFWVESMSPPSPHQANPFPWQSLRRRDVDR
jgi:hypothetical protein